MRMNDGTNEPTNERGRPETGDRRRESHWDVGSAWMNMYCPRNAPVQKARARLSIDSALVGGYLQLLIAKQTLVCLCKHQLRKGECIEGKRTYILS